VFNTATKDSNEYQMIQTPKVLNHCFDTTTPKVKWLFEQVQTPFRLLAFVSSNMEETGPAIREEEEKKKHVAEK
jgi:hypothetical protein